MANLLASLFFFFLRVQSSSLPHLGILMGSKILISSSERWQNPRTECQEPKWRPPWESGPSHPPTQELKQLTGRQGCGGCQHFQGLKTLNKQKINIQYFLQVTALWNSRAHYTEKEPAIFTILNSEKFRKTVIFFTLIYAVQNFTK